jgi:hypothetical protein
MNMTSHLIQKRREHRQTCFTLMYVVHALVALMTWARQARRRMQLHQLAWIKLLKTVHDESCAGSARTCTAGLWSMLGLGSGGNSNSEERIKAALGRCYTRGCVACPAPRPSACATSCCCCCRGHSVAGACSYPHDASSSRALGASLRHTCMPWETLLQQHHHATRRSACCLFWPKCIAPVSHTCIRTRIRVCMSVMPVHT